jgi:YD repeat-containing protein
MSVEVDETASSQPPEDNRSFEEFRKAGFLWLINTAVFHPRGFAIAFSYNSEGNVSGWQLLGDGRERWAFSEDGWPEGEGPDDAFDAAEREFAMAQLRSYANELKGVINENWD